MTSAAEDIMATNEEQQEMDELISMMKEMAKEDNERKELDANKDRLFVDRLPLQSSDLSQTLALNVIQSVAHFWIDDNLQYNSSKPLPKLNLPENLDDVELDLIEGFDIKTLIEDYVLYKDQKWRYMMKTIEEKDLINNYNPQFISFGGPIGEILATVYDTGIEWKIWAQRINGVIFIRKIQTERPKAGYLLQEFKKNSYAILKYLHFITDEQFNNMSEADKCFAVNEVQLGDHKMLILSEINAVDDHNHPIDGKLMVPPNNRDFYIRKKLLRFWSKAYIQGVDRLIVGTKKNDSLIAIEELTMEGIVSQCSKRWSPQQCINFLNRFLHLIQNCLIDDNVYELVYNRGEGFVECCRLHQKVKSSIVNEELV